MYLNVYRSILYTSVKCILIELFNVHENTYICMFRKFICLLHCTFVLLGFNSLCSLTKFSVDLHGKEAAIESARRTMQDLRYQIAKKDEIIQDIKRDADDLRTR